MLQNWTFSAFNGDIFFKNEEDKFMFKKITSLTNKKKQLNRDFIGMD